MPNDEWTRGPPFILQHRSTRLILILRQRFLACSTLGQPTLTSISVCRLHQGSSTLPGFCSVPPGSGRIRFHDPRGEHKILRHVYGAKAPPRYADAIRDEMPTVAPFVEPFAVEVSNGLLLLFPSWLVHEVEVSSGINDSDG